MLPHKDRSSGFTSLELLISIVVFGLLIVMLYPYFDNTVNQFLTLNKDAAIFSDLSNESQRIAKIVRGTTDILDAQNDEVTLYAYFSPNDNYVSQIKYYQNAAKDELLADVTPMTANPPQGMPVTASKKTYTIIKPFHAANGVNLFEYLDSAGSVLSVPISELHTIKGIRITVAAPTETTVGSSTTTFAIDVSLRNRKTNL